MIRMRPLAKPIPLAEFDPKVGMVIKIRHDGKTKKKITRIEVIGSVNLLWGVCDDCTLQHELAGTNPVVVAMNDSLCEEVENVLE
jgi:hypothetical protein